MAERPETKAKYDFVISLVKRGYDYEQVAKLARVRAAYVRSICSLRGISTRRRWEDRVPEDVVAKARELLERGMPIKHVADAVGAPHGSVHRYAVEQGYHTPKERHAIVWDKPKDDLIRQLYNKEWGNVRIIAARIGCTRDSVIGRANRLGLSKRRQHADGQTARGTAVH